MTNETGALSAERTLCPHCLGPLPEVDDLRKQLAGVSEREGINSIDTPADTVPAKGVHTAHTPDKAPAPDGIDSIDPIADTSAVTAAGLDDGLDAYFGATEAACYEFPEGDQAFLRDAFCRGALWAEKETTSLRQQLAEAQEREAQMAAALRGAHHGLVTSHNLRATDLSVEAQNALVNMGTPRTSLEWMNDNSKEIEVVEAALGLVPASPSPVLRDAVIVPREPTLEMQNRFEAAYFRKHAAGPDECVCDSDPFSEAYRAMIAASRPVSEREGVADTAPAPAISGDWVVRKGGYFYRPNSQGYTASILEAGRYTREEAEAHAAASSDEVTARPASDFPAPAISGGMVSVPREALAQAYSALMEADEDGLTEHAECMSTIRAALAAADRSAS